jgi:hypothetical protein
MEPAVQAHLECVSDLILRAGAKQHADIQVLGLVCGRADHAEVLPNGNIPGTDLAFFIELEFRSHISLSAS